MLTSHLQLKMKSETECPFLMYRSSPNIKHLPLLSTTNLTLVEFIHILTALDISFNKVVGLRPATLWKRNSSTGGFLWISRSFQERLFYRAPPGNLSDSVIAFQQHVSARSELQSGRTELISFKIVYSLAIFT